MHTLTLFLLCCFLAGDTTQSEIARALRRTRNSGDLPPLPQELEDDDIFMSIDDPRVGTVDEEGNVLVPVDENGRILPGFEHLFRFPERNGPKTAGGPAEVLAPSRELDPVAIVNKDIKGNEGDAYVDEDLRPAQLPPADDYVSSMEADMRAEKTSKVLDPYPPAPELNLTEVNSVVESESEVESHVDVLKVDRIVDEILELTRDNLQDENPVPVKDDLSGAAVVAAAQENPQDENGPEGDDQSVEDPDQTSNVEPIRPETPEEEEVKDIADEPEVDLIQEGPARIGSGVQEFYKELPVDDEEVDMEQASLRTQDVLKKQSDKPDSAAISSGLLVLFATILLCLWSA
ncbi:hypothetical protein Q1695_007236 [Nippostrongylus brasiliensis]|nr:hypothetical protein Q1695_007236 [Nippostrongylus brasiliensis]